MSTEKEYDRVTEVLYPFSGLQNVDKEVLANAATRGTRVHKICEGIVRGLGEFNVDDEVRGYVNSFKQWWNKDLIEIVEIEKRFFCDKLMISGQVDLIVKIEDKIIIVDLKTPQRPSKTWMLQGSAYAYMARQDGYDVKGVHFLQLNKHGMKPKIHEIEENFDLYKKCLDVYNYFYKPKEKDDKATTIKRPGKYSEVCAVSQVTCLPTSIGLRR